MDSLFAGCLLGEVVAGVGVAGYADTGIVVEHALNAAGGVGGAVGHRHLSGQTRSVELAAVGRRACENEWDLLELFVEQGIG